MQINKQQYIAFHVASYENYTNTYPTILNLVSGILIIININIH